MSTAERPRLRAGGDRPGERGAGSMLVAAIAMVLALWAAAAILLAGYLLAGHQARAAADLAVLSGAFDQRAGGAGCDRAREIAETNGVRMTDCRLAGDPTDFVLTVTVERRIGASGPRLGGLPGAVRATAAAGPAGTVAGPPPR